jgi:hypothetical protein
MLASEPVPVSIAEDVPRRPPAQVSGFLHSIGDHGPVHEAERA